MKDLTIYQVDGSDHINQLFKGFGDAMHGKPFPYDRQEICQMDYKGHHSNRGAVYMSHFDKLVRLPKDFVTIARSPNSEYAGIAHQTKPIYGRCAQAVSTYFYNNSKTI